MTQVSDVAPRPLVRGWYSIVLGGQINGSCAFTKKEFMSYFVKGYQGCITIVG
jgi:hypothetical protein